MKYTQIKSYSDVPHSYRFVIFKEDEYGCYKIRQRLIDFIADEFCSAASSVWRLYVREDGKKWKLTRADWDDYKTEKTVLVGVSLFHLACWVAKKYRDCFANVGCFVEECQSKE